MESLTQMILRFQATGTGKDRIMEKLARVVSRIPHVRHGWDRDTCDEFLTWFYPQLEEMLRSFVYRGTPFESYLKATLTFRFRTFAAHFLSARARWELSREPALWDPIPDVVRDPAPATRLDPDWRARRLFGLQEDGRPVDESTRNRLIIPLLKSAHWVGDREIAAVARLTGWSEEKLFSLVMQMRADLAGQRARLELYRTRRTRALHACYLVERAIPQADSPEKRNALLERRRRLRETMDRCQRIISRVRLSPTHAQIARALGVPPGTVDSTLYRLKRRAASLYATRHAC